MNDKERKKWVRLYLEIKAEENGGKPFKVNFPKNLKCMTSVIYCIGMPGKCIGTIPIVST